MPDREAAGINISRLPTLQFEDVFQYLGVRDRSHAKNKKTAWRQALGVACRLPAAGQQRFSDIRKPPQTA
jgi:hypothetical protein